MLLITFSSLNLPLVGRSKNAEHFSGGGPIVKLDRDKIKRSRELRAAATSHERRLWYKLRELKRLGFHVRRQAPFQFYFLDFVEHQAKLVIELDGSQHGEAEQTRKDERRDADVTTSVPEEVDAGSGGQCGQRRQALAPARGCRC